MIMLYIVIIYQNKTLVRTWLILLNTVTRLFSDLTEQEQALNGWKFGMIGVDVPNNSEITSQIADIVSAHSKVIWLGARVTDASISSAIGHAVAPEIAFLDNNTSRVFIVLTDVSNSAVAARGNFSAWLFYAYTDD